MTDAILVLNVGSSSLKFALYADEATPSVALLRGKIAGIGSHPIFSARDDHNLALQQTEGMRLTTGSTLDDIIPALLDWLKRHRGGVNIIAAGHRVVHGGRNHTGPAKVTEALLDELATLVPLAPLHQPHNLQAIRAVCSFLPTLPQVACFDTSFHRTQDRLAQLFALPRTLTDAGIIRYGFHGLSYDYIASRLPHYLGAKADARVVMAHLGNGASMCAMKARQSVATSMGFTALDGLMMGQRCGSIDPGVLLYLLDGLDMTTQELKHLLYEESGLLGVSGISNDMAILQSSPAPEALEAIELFCYRAACELAALCTTIGGLDAIVFTAGIGENSALVRRLICDHLAWMGVALDGHANERNEHQISSTTSTVDVMVIPTNEEMTIACATHRVTTQQVKRCRSQVQ
ncbi:acetate/propionate family kinase [Vreelandella boliviensis]|uniref:Acetate kinase n=1 Tax=Vreelandella boliviensis LC1 TaxID=1072583 RepID=A0A265DZM2_9GAMM|nr:acetate/propionate family kinase [Halomonas boliviensis]EHJ91549.1 Acetate kinase [Halomonas boliviensis LC1]OZT74772.1 acetate/propionate family kinase [Halomonas boliviensis LC1]